MRCAILAAAAVFALCGCGGGAAGSSTSSPPVTGGGTVTITAPQSCASTATPAPTPTPVGVPPTTPAGLTVPSGFTIQIIANVGGARELTVTPNGDLLVATSGASVAMIQNALALQPAAPHTYATIDDAPDAGIAFSQAQCAVYVATQHGIYRIPYTIGDQTAASPPQKIASVRTGSVAPNSDGDVHTTTSVAVSDATGTLYASVGSSCNACTEVDPTRATIQQMHPDGSSMTTRATRIRNAIALAIDPTSGALWAGGAGQDDLPAGHPYEYVDDVSSHSGVPDYGWPGCEENHNAFGSGADCSNTVIPLVELPAYSTIIGAVFYPSAQSGQYAFPPAYRGGIFLAAHGSWHRNPDGTYAARPRVAFVPMNGDAPKTPVDWTNPTTQWSDFVGGFQQSDSKTRIGRPTGIAVAPDGSLFVADDMTGNIYRIRP